MDDEAEIRNVVLDEGESAIASAEEEQFHGVLNGLDCWRGQSPMHFEANEI